jgi:hypothetical protein
VRHKGDMGNAASSGITSGTAVPPQSKSGEALREHQPQSARAEQHPPEPFWEATFSDPVAFWTLWLALATTALWFFTYRLWRATKTLAEDAKTTSADQAEKMERSVEEAAKSAAAMVRVAESMAINATQIVRSVDITKRMADNQEHIFGIQMRAYIHVEVGTAYPQDRERAVTFGARPLVANSGNTPAERVRFSIKAGILPVPLPDVYVLELPPLSDSEGMIPQNQSRTFTAFVDDFVPDDEVEKIMWGAGPRGLFVWGRLVYCDVFSKEHTTDFCQHLFFVAKDGGGFIVDGFHTPGRNTAT